MGLPIAIGAKSSSWRPIPSPIPQPDYAPEDDGSTLQPVIVDQGPRSIVAVCSQKEWFAFISLSYYDMFLESCDDDGTGTTANHHIQTNRQRHSTVAEVRIQISPSSLPFSSTYRDCVHRIPLPHSGKEQATDEEDCDRSCSACAVFSSNRRYLICLIPYPHGSPNSVVVKFELRKPRSMTVGSKPIAAPPPLPSYVSEIPPKSWVPVTTNPQLLKVPDWLHSLLTEDLLSVTAICDACTTTTTTSITSTTTTKTSKRKQPGVLLAGCRNGTILAIFYGPVFVVAGIMYQPPVIVAEKVSFLSHMAYESDCAEEITGKLVAIRGKGTVSVFSTHLVVSSMSFVAADDESFTSASSRFFTQQTSQRSLVIEGNQRSSIENSPRSPNRRSFVIDESERGVDCSTSEKDDGSDIIWQHGPFRKDFEESMTKQHEKLDHVNGGMHNSNLQVLLSPQQQMQNSNLQTPLSPQRHSAMLHLEKDSVHDNVVIQVEPLTEVVGDFSCACWITDSLLALMSKPGADVATVQVWTMFDYAPSKKVSELLVTDETLNDHSHTHFAFDGLDEPNSNPHDRSSSARFMTRRLQGTMGIEYDTYCGCLAISSAISCVEGHAEYKEKTSRPFVCIWHWRTNVLGFMAAARTRNTAQPRFYPMIMLSRLFFVRDKQSGLKLSHVQASVDSSWTSTKYRIRKQLYSTGLLSPSQEVSCIGWGVQEACPLLLSSSSVAYPSISRPSSSDICEVEWHESRIPNEYLSSYGHPKIAAIGKGRGQSIAVASSSGICILDCSRVGAISGPERSWDVFQGERDIERYKLGGGSGSAAAAKIGAQLNPKWRLFGNVSHEKAFRVLALTWWEGRSVLVPNNDEKSCCESNSDDFLVAIIQLQQPSDRSKRWSPCYLACWSPRRFDVSHQLLTPSKQSSEVISQWGIRLPGNFHQASLKLLAQPESPESVQQKRKAVLLVSTRADGPSDVRFELFQLQVVTYASHQAESYMEQKPYSVIAKQCSRGEIKKRAMSMGQVSSIFLASASFSFDLDKEVLHSNDDMKAPAENIENEFLATVGIVRSPGGGLDAATLSPSGATFCLPVLGHDPRSKVSNQNVLSNEVTTYWFADTVNSCSISGEHNVEVDFLLWTFLLADGRLFCWSVPYWCHKQKGKDPRSMAGPGSFRLFHDRIDDTSPKFVCYNDITFGIVCSVGTSDNWLSQSSSRCRNDFSVGCLPGSSLGCVLCVGQGSRKLHRTLMTGEFDLEYEILCPSDFILTPPVFISSVFALILEAALIRPSCRSLENEENTSNITSRLMTIHSHMRSRLQLSPYQDAAFMSLRLFVLRSVEYVAEQASGGTKISRSFAAAIFGEVIDIVRQCTTRLQFASLILEVGRQVEPSFFSYLFPLPLPLQPLMRPSDATKNYDTVADLFSVCMEEGSLLTSVSALPLFHRSTKSLILCLHIFCHCLRVFEENIALENDLCFDYSTDERLVLHDIFCFGLKLEDMKSDLGQPMDGESDAEASTHSNAVESGSVASVSSKSSSLSDTVGGISFTCGLMKSNWFGDKESKLVSNSSDSTSTHDGDEQSLKSLEVAERDNDSIETFASVVGSRVVRVISDDAPNRWKKTSALARLLLGQGDSSMFQRCSTSDWGEVVEGIRFEDLQFLLQSNQIKDIESFMTDFLIVNIQDCSGELSEYEAAPILDLIMILLHRRECSKDLEKILPSLVIVCLIVAHVSMRIDELLETVKDSAPMNELYVKSKDKGIGDPL